jgi:hypothetical protein
VKRITITIVLAGAIAAIVAPAAFGSGGAVDDRPFVHGIGVTPTLVVGADDRSFVHGIGVAPVVGVAADDRPVVHGIGVSPVVTVSADDRSFIRGTGPEPVTLSPDDRPYIRDFVDTSLPQPATQVTLVDNGFNWGDAGIGLAAGVGFMLLLAAGIVTLRRARVPLAHS